MTFVLKDEHSTTINNKEREYFLNLEQNEDYGFKYIPESHFKHIVKNVQRQRRREDEERIWSSFVKEQELNSIWLDEGAVRPSMQSVKELIRESIYDVDRELKRLEEDARPERSKRISSGKTGACDKRIGVKVTGPKDTSQKKLLVAKDNDVCRVNLIPILEEENTPNQKKPPESKRTMRKTKKSMSDPSISHKKLLRSKTNYENNSSTELSTRPDDDKHDINYVRPDPLTIQKILTMQKKITELLDEISFRLCRIPLPDGDNDLKRRQQRAMEFAIRFSRNYLYDLNRFVTSIQRHIAAISPRAGLKQNRRTMMFHQETMEQKLIAAHQLLLHALTAYCNHIPTSIIRGHPTKLKEVLEVVVELKGICDKAQISTNYFGSGDADPMPVGKELQKKCDAILSKLNRNFENEQASVNYNNTESKHTLASTSLHNRKRSDRKNLSTRLSMYSVDIKMPTQNYRKQSGHRKKSYSYQKPKKYTIADAKAAYTQDHVAQEVQYPSPATYTSSTRNIRQDNSTKYTNYTKEDDIKTMMDGISIDSENDSNFEVQNKRNNENPVGQKFRASQRKVSADTSKLKNIGNKEKNGKINKVTNDEELTKTVMPITKEHLSTIVPVIADLMSLVSKKNEVEVQPVSGASMETLLEFLEKYQSPKDLDTKVVSNCCTSQSVESWESLRVKPNRFCENRTNGKNMRLICMSAAERASQKSSCDVSCQASDIQPNIIELTVSKNTEEQFLEYQRAYQNLCRQKPMYSSNTQNKPWDVVAWISDKLVEELLIEIARELQMNDVIQKLFEMEFQEF